MIYAFHAAPVLLFGQLVLAALYYIVLFKIRKCKYRPLQWDAEKKRKIHPDGDLQYMGSVFHLFFRDTEKSRNKNELRRKNEMNINIIQYVKSIKAWKVIIAYEYKYVSI